MPSGGQVCPSGGELPVGEQPPLLHPPPPSAGGTSTSSVGISDCEEGSETDDSERASEESEGNDCSELASEGGS